jgi:hypothetical protein
MRTYFTANHAGKILERSEYADSSENNAKRVKRSPEIYSARQQITEHVFGTIKWQWGYDHILLSPDSYRVRKNDGEFGLIYLVYNIRRIINILGVESAKKWVQKTLFPVFHAVMLSGVYGWNNAKYFFSRDWMLYTAE